jgi:hypothetical protein
MCHATECHSAQCYFTKYSSYCHLQSVTLPIAIELIVMAPLFNGGHLCLFTSTMIERSVHLKVSEHLTQKSNFSLSSSSTPRKLLTIEKQF